MPSHSVYYMYLSYAVMFIFFTLCILYLFAAFYDVGCVVGLVSTIDIFP